MWWFIIIPCTLKYVHPTVKGSHPHFLAMPIYQVYVFSWSNTKHLWLKKRDKYFGTVISCALNFYNTLSTRNLNNFMLKLFLSIMLYTMPNCVSKKLKTFSYECGTFQCNRKGKEGWSLPRLNIVWFPGVEIDYHLFVWVTL